jgi:hypothetical protein
VIPLSSLSFEISVPLIQARAWTLPFRFKTSASNIRRQYKFSLLTKEFTVWEALSASFSFFFWRFLRDGAMMWEML